MRLLSSLSAMVLVYISISLSAQAQVTIELGGDSSEVKRILVSQGYSDVAIIKRSFTATTAEGCLQGIRFRVKILITGQTKWRQEIGKCRSEITIEKARKLLRNQGYSRIDLEARRGAFVAIACLNETRFRVSVDRFGDIRRERNLGSCRANALSPTDIKAELRRQGYSRIKFTDRQLPRYVVEACLGLQRYELVLARDGDIRQELNIGRCERAINPRNLKAIMEKNGFRRIKIIDDQLPRYVVEACRNNRRMEVTLNRFGRIIDQFELGRCTRRLSKDRLLQSLGKQGLSRIDIISQNDRGFVVRACRGQKLTRIRFNPYGDVLKETNLGACKSRTVREIAKALRERQMKGMRFYAEGCRRGRKIRVEFNRLGDPTGRKRLGKC